MSIFDEVNQVKAFHDNFRVIYRRLLEQAKTEEEKAAIEEFLDEYIKVSDLAIDMALLKVDYKHNPDFDIKEYIKD